jgi:hypothetical protein
LVLLGLSVTEFGDRVRCRAMRWTTYHFVWGKNIPRSLQLSQLSSPLANLGIRTSRGSKVSNHHTSFHESLRTPTSYHGASRLFQKQPIANVPCSQNILPFDFPMFLHSPSWKSYGQMWGHEVLSAVQASPHSSRFRSPSPFSPPGLCVSLEKRGTFKTDPLW